MRGPTVPETTVTEMPDDAFLLDVREAHEWSEAHPPTAVHVPMSQITVRATELPRDRTLYVICGHGYRSRDVAEWLNGQGFEAISVAGGLEAWTNAGKPVVW